MSTLVSDLHIGRADREVHRFDGPGDLFSIDVCDACA